jgi:hypothetical protein
VEAVIEAVSSTAPAAVTQERLGSGERKNTIAGIEVWVSSMSVNQASQVRHTSSKWSSPSIRAWRISNSDADGGDPARTSSPATAASRRENDA